MLALEVYKWIHSLYYMHLQCLGYKKRKKSNCDYPGESNPSSRKKTNGSQPKDDPDVEIIKQGL